MSRSQTCAGDLEEERHGPKRVCVRVQQQNLTVDPKAASLKDQHTSVGAPAASVGSSGATGAFEGITMDKNASLVVGDATVETSVRLQCVDATLESNITLQSHDAIMGSNDATFGTDDALLQFPDGTLTSACCDSQDATVASAYRQSLGSEDATVESDSTSLQTIDAFYEPNDASSESSSEPKSADAREAVKGSRVEVSVIIPVHNGAAWLEECLQGVSDQDFQGSLEISVFDDASTDNSKAIAESWREKLKMRGVPMVISGHNTSRPRGVGFAKNKAVAQSSGRYLCFQDADDVMMPQRVRLQYQAASLNPNCIIGCKVRRIPEGSTERYTRWINTLSPEQLLTQVYTSHGPTVVMPTWFCSRPWFQKVGSFDEGGKGVPEDLLWFYQSLRLGGGAIRVDECLLIYRYHEHAATHSVLEETIWSLRVDFLEERVLRQWSSFTIWNAGKQGRKLYRSLTTINKKKVKAFCDVDENKIKKGFYTYEESKERPKPRVPVLHYRDSSPPFIICVKLDMTGGVLEDTLLSLGLKEGLNYYHFN